VFSYDAHGRRARTLTVEVFSPASFPVVELVGDSWKEVCVQRVRGKRVARSGLDNFELKLSQRGDWFVTQGVCSPPHVGLLSTLHD
jgi:hypothetical protein